MTEATIAVANKPAWVDLASDDAAASRDFYAKLLGWQLEVNPDPQYGGYALARIGGKDVAGIGPKQDASSPTAWSVYIGTDDVDETAKKVQAAGGTVVAPPFEVGDQGRMAVFQDPSGAFISAWEPRIMGGFQTNTSGALGWAELNARGLDKALPFYQSVFGWTGKQVDSGAGNPPYTEFHHGGERVAGAMEMNPAAPAQVPSYWAIYFNVDDVDNAHRKALSLGAQEMLPPQDFPGGRFSIVSDPQGASFGLLKVRG